MLVPALAGVINVFASSPIFVVSTRLRAAQPGQHRDTCPPYLPISPYISTIFPYTSPGARPVPRYLPISSPSHHAPGQYRDAMDCLRETLAEGAASLWSGLVPVSHTWLQPRTSKTWLGLGLG